MQVFYGRFGSLAQHDLEAVVTGLGSGVLFAAADDFAIGGHVVEAVLAGFQKRLKALGLAIGLHGTDAVFVTGFGRVAFAGLNNFAVDGAQVVPVLAAALEDLESCHGERGSEVVK